MATFLNPMEAFDDLVGFFEIAADEGGIALDAELCAAFAEGIADLGDKFEALVGYARATGCPELIEPDPARTPAERAALAHEILTAALGGKVVELPDLVSPKRRPEDTHA